MEEYSSVAERQMGRFYRSLSERDRRRYAAVEVTKLGHGGIEYTASLFGCDPNTIASGITDLEGDEELDTSRQRKKGVDGNRCRNQIRCWSRTFLKSRAITRPVIRCVKT